MSRCPSHGIPEGITASTRTIRSRVSVKIVSARNNLPLNMKKRSRLRDPVEKET